MKRITIRTGILPLRYGLIILNLKVLNNIWDFKIYVKLFNIYLVFNYNKDY